MSCYLVSIRFGNFFFGTDFVVFGTVLLSFFGTTARFCSKRHIFGRVARHLCFTVSALCFPFRHYVFPFRHYVSFRFGIIIFIYVILIILLKKKGQWKRGLPCPPIRPDGYPRLKSKRWYDGQKLGLHSRVLRFKSLSSRDWIVRKIEILIFLNTTASVLQYHAVTCYIK
jgi:hypothetical protein